MVCLGAFVLFLKNLRVGVEDTHDVEVMERSLSWGLCELGQFSMEKGSHLATPIKDRITA